MASEKFANLAETTLSAGYTAGSGSISVTSAAAFPTTGVFRVRLAGGTMIFRVDSVAGTTFTGAAEANDANQAGGASVILVATKAVGERFVQSPEANEMNLLSGAAAVDEYSHLLKVKRLDQSAWTWLAQGSAAFVQANGLVQVTGHHAAGTTQIRGRYFAYPATPFTIIAGFKPFFPASTNLNNLAAWGIGGYESATTKMVLLNGANFDYANGNALQGNFSVQGMTNPTTTATNYGQSKAGTAFNNWGINNLVPPFLGIYWLKYFDNGTNITFSWSWDKVTWVDIVTQARATGYTTMADKFGWFMQLQSATVTIANIGWIVSWEQS